MGNDLGNLPRRQIGRQRHHSNLVGIVLHHIEDRAVQNQPIAKHHILFTQTDFRCNARGGINPVELPGVAVDNDQRLSIRRGDNAIGLEGIGAIADGIIAAEVDLFIGRVVDRLPLGGKRDVIEDGLEGIGGIDAIGQHCQVIDKAALRPNRIALDQLAVGRVIDPHLPHHPTGNKEIIGAGIKGEADGHLPCCWFHQEGALPRCQVAAIDGAADKRGIFLGHCTKRSHKKLTTFANRNALGPEADGQI